MEQWSTTLDTRTAAAFGTLGMPVRVKNTLDEKSGKEVVRFQIGLMNMEGTMRTNRLRACLKNGSLEAAQPSHPLLTIHRAYRNRELLLAFQKTGQKIELVPVRGAPGIFEYVVGDRGLPGVERGQAYLKTGDLKMVSALGIMGCRLLAMEGSGNNHLYKVAAINDAGVSGVQLMMDWRASMESIPWEQPFAQAARGLYNRERLLDAVRDCQRMILLRHGKGIRSALIDEQASDKAWDQVSAFFG
jgi:hypothetical protein